jgi:hypothetical protein
MGCHPRRRDWILSLCLFALVVSFVLSATGCGSRATAGTSTSGSGSPGPASPSKTLSSIALSPGNTSIAVGATQQFTATAVYSDSSTAVVTTSATWTSSAAATATINASGLATGGAAGSATIAASYSGVSATTTLTVTATTPPAPTLSSISISPANASITTGATQQFTATGTYNDGSTANVTSTAAWTSSNTSVATINSAGLATAVAGGSTTIAAALSGVSGDVPLTVTNPSPPPTGTVNVTTWHVDNNRSGLNSSETALTPTSVSAQSFGKLFSYLVDGYVYGEPLLMSGVTINGATHDVLYVATENDSVYAFDADSYGSGTPLWHVSLLQSGETPITGGAIAPVEGVTSTPVIDPTTNTLYVVSVQTSSTNGGTFRLHALDITTGQEKLGGPATLQASLPGTGSGGTTVSLTTSCIQRSALLLANGNVYFGFGSCPRGWLLAYSASTLAQVGVFTSSPNLNGEGTYASAGGIWMGGGGPVADSAGNVYVVTGNGPWDGQTAFADSILKFSPTLQLEDYFTPDDYQFMDCDDADLASGGLLLIPGTTELLAGGKTGTLYLVNSTRMGHEQANDSGATQTLVWGQGLTNGGSYSATCNDSAGVESANITSYEIFGTSAYYNNYVYLGVTPTASSAPAGVRQFQYAGSLTPGAFTTPNINQGTRGTTPFISSNGSSGGIMWMIDTGNPLQNSSGATPSSSILRAYDADMFPNELYDTTMNSSDTPGYGIKFTSPVAANGKVYMSTGHDLTTVSSPQGEIDVYGLK